MFPVFFEQGFNHLLPPGAMDHILFLVAICCIYNSSEWKKLLWIVTSFTLAHSLALALSISGFININSSVIEFLIACTIAFTCLENIFLPSLHKYRVLFSGFFGLIHGLGFSNQLKSLFMGMELNFWQTLLPFNLGLELAQLLVLGLIIALLTIIRKINVFTERVLTFSISVLVLIPAIYWLYERNIFTN